MSISSRVPTLMVLQSCDVSSRGIRYCSECLTQVRNEQTVMRWMLGKWCSIGSLFTVCPRTRLLVRVPHWWRQRQLGVVSNKANPIFLPNISEFCPGFCCGRRGCSRDLWFQLFHNAPFQEDLQMRAAQLLQHHSISGFLQHKKLYKRRKTRWKETLK